MFRSIHKLLSHSSPLTVPTANDVPAGFQPTEYTSVIGGVGCAISCNRLTGVV